MRYNLSDTDFERVYDEITQLAAFICDTPVALISFVDDVFQYLDNNTITEETSPHLAFCAHANLQINTFVVEDTCNNEHFIDNPLVFDHPYSRFYASAELVNADGYALGKLCAIDSQPKKLTPQQLNSLKILAKQIVTQLELKLALKTVHNYAEELKELNASKDKFFSLIAHDLKAPFHSILGFAELLKNEAESFNSKEVADLAGEIYSSGRNAFKLLQNLLQWSMLETGKVQCHPENLEINCLIQETLSLVYPMVKEKNIQLNTNLLTENIKVRCDRNMLVSIMQNLLTNAIKFTPQGGKIVIETEEKESQIQINITDNGVGMTEKQIENLFKIDKCQTTEGTSGEKGTGLGLLLCKEFVEKNGGEMSVTSQQNQGSTFSFTVPISSF